MPHPESEHGLRVQLATALRERDEARDDLGASHSRGAHLHCSKDRCDVAADGMALAAANARADAAEALAEDRRKARDIILGDARENREALAAARRESKLFRDALEKAADGLRYGETADLSVTMATMRIEAWRGIRDAYHAARAALAAPAAAAVRDPATEDADAAWRDGEAHGRDPK